MIRNLSCLRSKFLQVHAAYVANLRYVAILASLMCVQTLAAAPRPSQFTIVLIGGDKQGYPRAEHDYPDGILAIERLIKGSPQLQAQNPIIKAFPSGFPRDLSQIADADVVVVYFGADYRPSRMTNPVEDPDRLTAMKKLMAQGVGLVALH